MEVTFRKGKAGRTCSWEARRRTRSRVPGTTMAAGGDVPHDLVTFVVERALGISHGFWGCVADGATFRSLGRPRTRPGREVIERHRPELDDAEQRVNHVYRAWRQGQPTPAAAALDDALERWQALGEGDEMVLTWPDGARRPRRR